MRFQDLSPADQALVKSDFGEMDKVAAALVAQASECYEYGHDKIALEIADGLEKAAADELAAEEEAEKTASEIDPDFDKTAAELGAFTEKGTFDGLAKLGQERYGDPMAYFWPFVEQKIAQVGAQRALEKAASIMGKLAAEDNPEGHHVRRALLGNPISAAIEAKPGHKMNQFGKAYGHAAVESAKGTGKGLLAGGALGALGGAAHGAATGHGGKGRAMGALRGAGFGGAVGGLGGASVGSLAGAIKGNHGAEASRIHGEKSQNK